MYKYTFKVSFKRGVTETPGITLTPELINATVKLRKC